MCIYFKNNPELTYKEKEHIFPAGLGGITTLSKGLVSDQANSLFSKLEINFMNCSLVSLYRSLLGPGTRNGKKGKPRTPTVTIGKQTNGDIVLSYTFRGQPIILNQIHILKQDKKTNVKIHVENNENNINKNEFINELKKFNGKYTYINSNIISKSDLIIGYYNNHFYIAKNEITRPKEDEIKLLINEFISFFRKNDSQFTVEINNITQHYTGYENNDTHRVYAKIAFNVLAFLKGEEFVQQNEFDDFRRWIITGDFEEKHLVNFGGENNPICEQMPNFSHYCIFYNYSNYLFVEISLYNSVKYVLKIGKLPEKAFNFICDGFICDWKNKKEYKLFDYIDIISNKNESIGNKMII